MNEIRSYLKKNKEGYLYKFYQSCFTKNEEKNFLWFKKTLLRQYITTFGLDILLGGLDYLAQSQLVLPNTIKTTLIHGDDDSVAPIAEALSLKDTNPHVDLITLDNTGHMPFLRPGFKDCLAGTQ